MVRFTLFIFWRLREKHIPTLKQGILMCWVNSAQKCVRYILAPKQHMFLIAFPSDIIGDHEYQWLRT